MGLARQHVSRKFLKPFSNPQIDCTGIPVKVDIAKLLRVKELASCIKGSEYTPCRKETVLYSCLQNYHREGLAGVDRVTSKGNKAN